MASLIFTALVPHPPILFPEVGGAESDRVQTTFDSMERLAADLASRSPEVVVIISPHGPVFHDAIAVHRLEQITGDLAAFGAEELAMTAMIDQQLGELVIEEARRERIMTAPVTEEWAEEWGATTLDHGSLVPLLFLDRAGWRGRILPIGVGLLPPLELYRFGQALQRAIERLGRPVALLASGDLSHRLSPDSEGGYAPEGAEFDRQVVEALGRGELASLYAIDPVCRERAAECGYRPLLMLSGALDGLRLRPLVLSYEHPFGVGYGVVAIEPAGLEPGQQLLPLLQEARSERIQREREAAAPLVQLARAALEHYVKTGLQIDFSAGAPHEGTTPWHLPPELPERAGCFVTLTVDGDLRGCMGTIGPSEPTLALEVVQNAIKAGVEDPRFLPVEEEELPFLTYKVDLLSEPEPTQVDQLDPRHYGLMVRKGDAVGLLLPDLPGIERVEAQVEIACRKAGLEPGEPGIELFRFQVQRFG